MSKNRGGPRAYRVKFRELNVGRDGGTGDPKTCKLHLRDPSDAANHMKKKHIIIVSVRRIKG